MAITQSNTLSEIQFAKNHIPVVLNTDNYITTAGVASYKSILLDVLDIGTGKTLIITWPLNELTFTTAQTPDNSGLEIPRADEYANTDDWTAAIVSYLVKNEVLNEAFHVWTVGHLLQFEAKQTGIAYDISSGISGTINFSPGQQNIPADEVRNEVKVVLSVYIFKEVRSVTGSLTYDFYEKVKTYELEPLNDSTATFLLEGALIPYLTKDVKPTFNQTTIQTTENYLTKFYYRYSERETSNQLSTIQSDILYAVNGGLSRLDFENNGYDDIFNGSQHKFLSWHPVEKELTKNQHDYLYYVKRNTFPFLDVRYLANLADGTIGSIDVRLSTADENSVHIIPVGYNYVNGLAFLNDVVSYEVFIQYVDFPIFSLVTEKRTYKIIENTPLLNKTYLFQNSLGVYESINLYAEPTNGVQINKLESKRIIQLDDNASVNENIISNTYFNNVTKVYTGYKTQKELRFLTEFLKSEEVYEQKNTSYSPVTVKTKKADLFKDQEFINSFPIEIISNTEKNYSNA